MRRFERLPGPSQLFDQSSDDQSPSYERPYEQEDLYPYPAVGSLSISAPSLSYARERSPDAGSLHQSDSRSNDVGSNDGDGSPKGKRRRAESPETDDTTKKSRSARKTAIACNFCRGELILLGQF